MLRSLIKFFLVGLLTIVAGGIVLAVAGAVVGTVVGLASFLLFRVAPVLLVGWLGLKLFDKVRRRDALTAADRRWLDRD